MPPKRILIAALKIGVSLAILGWLYSKARNDRSFADLLEQPKQWHLLFVATLAALASVAITFVRWFLLLRAVAVPTSLGETFRLGFLGYLFNFFSVGIIGGDVLKAVLLARHHPERRPEAVASVVIDRVIGLYALFLVAAVSFLFVDLASVNARNPDQFKAVDRVCRATFFLTGVGGVGLVAMMIPPLTRGRLWDKLFTLPKVGRLLERLVRTLRLYQKRRGIVFVSLLMSLAVHALSTVSIYLTALGLPGEEPSLGAHFVIVPISLVAGAVPLPGGLGAFEAALDFLYRGVSSVAVSESQGFIVALAYRVITMVIAAIGLGYYLTGRREVADGMKEAETLD